MTAPLPLSLLHPEVLQNPYPVYRYYRENDPINFFPGKVPRFQLTRHRDILEALSGKFLKRRVKSSFWDESINTIPADLLDYTRTLREWILYKDPPEHKPLRQVVNRLVANTETEGFKGWVHAVAEEVFSTFPTEPGAVVDVMEDYARVVTMRVVTDMLGVTPLISAERMSDLLHFVQSTLASPYNPSAAAQAGAQMVELHGLVHQAMRVLSEKPGRAVLLQSLAREAELGNLRPEQVLPMASFLMLAARDNVRSAIASCVNHFIQQAGTWSALREDEALIPNAIQEVIRFEAPLQSSGRNADEDFEIGGVLIPKGMGVLSYIAAANRDPEIFPDPDVLDIRRDCSKMVSFGVGLHRCPGERLTRIILQESVTVLLRNWANPRLVLDPADLRWTGAVFRRLQSLPVEIH